MLDNLVNIYIDLYVKNFSKKSKWNFVANLISKIIRFFILFFLLNCYKKPKKSLSNDDKIIVSLTTFPFRISSLRYTLLSIFRQTVLPDRIIVNLIKSECPNGWDDLPNDLIEFKNKGVIFCFRDENLKPHNKYYYTFKDYPNSLIITIDDDYYYKSDLIEKLINLHHHYPDSVCANLVRKIKMSGEAFSSYEEWGIYNKNVRGHEFLALGFGGVLYPASLFKNSMLLNKELFKELSFATDDLWLKAIELVSDIPVVSGSFDGFPLSLETGKVNALSATNVGQNRNDINWLKLDDYFKLHILLQKINNG